MFQHHFQFQEFKLNFILLSVWEEQASKLNHIYERTEAGYVLDPTEISMELMENFPANGILSIEWNWAWNWLLYRAMLVFEGFSRGFILFVF